MRLDTVAFVATLLTVALASSSAPAQTPDPHTLPVKAVGPLSFHLSAPAGSGDIRYFGTGSLDGNAAGPLANGTIVITPQFLADVDIPAHRLSSQTLGWNWNQWLNGEPALTPAPLSAFDVFDAIIARLSDRAHFPRLREIVVAGHSAGGQVVQRYAVVGRPGSALPIRYIVSNPSSYLYFNTDRHTANGTFAPYTGSACPKFNRWKYGLEELPPYVAATAGLEERYMQRRVTYLLGLLDVDPNHPVLDKSCAGELQGAYRLIRGRNYVAYLEKRHPHGTNQDEVDVPGVDHDGPAMFASPCGVAVLFAASLSGCDERKI